MQAFLHSMPPTLKQANTDPRLCWRLLDTHWQVWVSLSWGHCSFLLGPGAQGSVCTLQESVPQGKFWCKPLGPGAQGTSEPSECLSQVWGLILNMLLPFLPYCRGFSFALGCGLSFFGGIQHSPVCGCSAASCNFGVLAGADECTSFYSAISYA